MSFPCCESIDMAVIPDDEISSVLIVGAGRLNAPIKMMQLGVRLK